jgi:hypothetical protein
VNGILVALVWSFRRENKMPPSQAAFASILQTPTLSAGKPYLFFKSDDANGPM